jgi:tRNA(Ile)-lysidine synthase
LPKTPPEARVPRPQRRAAAPFGPAWLYERLNELLPAAARPRLCVAFSGGLDSSALLAALAPSRRASFQVRAVHVDHRLRPDSARWAAHCRRVARSLGITLNVLTAEVRAARGESLEAAARRERYALLAAALAPGEALLTAHHQDDQLETVLLQLLRGAGIAGLAAMPAVAPLGRGLLVRPLLGVRRGQLGEWVREQGLSWVEDDSNADLRFDRNYLRARVLPLLAERWPAAAASVARSARHAAEAQALLEDLAAKDLAHARVGARLSAKVLRTLPLPRRRNALRAWIAAAGMRAPPARRTEEICTTLLAARVDSQPEVAWEGARCERRADLLSLVAVTTGASAPAPVADVARAAPWHWHREETCVLPGAQGTLTLRRDVRGPINLAALPATLSVRTRRGGERLRPVRGGPRRTLKGLLQESRVPPAQRLELPLIFDGARLLAAADLWIDESVRADSASRERGRLIWRPAV